MNIGVFIQCRLASTRLPNKAILPLNDLPSIVHTYRRARSAGLYTIVIIPSADIGSPLEAVLKEYHVQYGCIKNDNDEDDVLARYFKVARAENADYVIRITGDCVLIDPEAIVATAASCGGDRRFLSNIYPDRQYVRGLDVEAMRFDALTDAYYATSDPYDREHVTPWMQRHETVTSIYDDDTRGTAHLRWCLDTPDDYTFLSLLGSEIDLTPPGPDPASLLAFLDDHPEISALCRESSLERG